MGNSDWTNPVGITIVNPILEQDTYEVNDSEIVATQINPVYINDSSENNIYTTIFSEEDIDFFKINLSSADTTIISVVDNNNNGNIGPGTYGTDILGTINDI